MFLCLNGSGNKSEGLAHIEALGQAGSNESFKGIAKAAGSDWPLRTHQCRRTYARCFVESRMGRTSLVFLKWQLKHSSMSMTQLYASNPLQDLTLFDEILQQMTEFKIDLIESWLDDQPLAGGAGTKIVELRAIPVRTGPPCWPRRRLMRTFAQPVTDGALPLSVVAEALGCTRPPGVLGANTR